jgi:hypothetical protein
MNTEKLKFYNLISYDVIEAAQKRGDFYLINFITGIFFIGFIASAVRLEGYISLLFSTVTVILYIIYRIKIQPHLMVHLVWVRRKKIYDLWDAIQAEKAEEPNPLEAREELKKLITNS